MFVISALRSNFSKLLGGLRDKHPRSRLCAFNDSWITMIKHYNDMKNQIKAISNGNLTLQLRSINANLIVLPNCPYMILC